MTVFKTTKIGLFVFLLNSFFLTSIVNAQKKSIGLTLAKTVPLLGVHGKFDHIAVDSKHNKLFLAAKGNNSVEVVDFANEKMIYSIKNVAAPQGILFIPKKNMILVCGGGDGTLKGFDATTYKEKFVLHLGGEADNIRYSAIRNRVYVAFGDGAIAVIDATTFKKLSIIPCTAHPEAFSLDSLNKKIWVNIPDKKTIKMFSLDSEKELATWKNVSDYDNYAMTIVERCHKLIVASRTNPTISVLNSETGELMQSFKCDSDPDAMFYDEKTNRVFISCGGGSIYILNDIMNTTIKEPVIIPTRKKARTCLWVSEINSLFVAMPEIDGKVAEITIYK